MNDDRRKQLDSLKNYLMKRSKDHLKNKFVDMAEPMNQVEPTIENFYKLFPDSKVQTPTGKVKLRSDQYKKLHDRGRENLLGTMKQTLGDPIAVINEDRNGVKSKIFGKSFSDTLPKDKILISVINHKNEGVTMHDRELNNFLNKIKNPADLLYEKPTNGKSPAGDDAYARDLAISGNTQSSINIPQSLEEIKRNIAKANREALNNNNL